MNTEIKETEAAKVVKMSDRATVEIRQKIISGDFPPGMKLLESDLARRLGFSKVPVREALLRLERDGLVVMAPSRSARVFDMGPDEITDLSELRQILELQALNLSASRNLQALAAELEDIAVQMVTSVDTMMSAATRSSTTNSMARCFAIAAMSTCARISKRCPFACRRCATVCQTISA